jgi:hypothetical protein
MTGPHKAVNGSRGAPQPREKPEPPPDLPKRYMEGAEAPAEPPPEIEAARRLADLELARAQYQRLRAPYNEAMQIIETFHWPALVAGRARLQEACGANGHRWLDLWQPDGLGWHYDTCIECAAPRYRKPAADAANRSA